MKLLALGLAALAYPLPTAPGLASVRYSKHELFELVIAADLVVIGRVRSVGWFSSYSVDVQEVVVGEPVERLKLRKFEDWICGSRWAPYARGQEVLLFLDALPDGRWNAIGGGAEGDMPIVDGLAIAEYRVRDHPRATFEVGGRSVAGAPLPLAEFTEAIRGFREALRWDDRVGPHGTGLIGPRRDLEHAEAYATSSSLARHLFDEARSSRHWPDPEIETEQVPGSLPRIVAAEYGFAGEARVPKDRPVGRFEAPERTGFGRACAFVPDVDGDGVEDLLVGAPRDALRGPDEGTAWLLLLDRAGAPHRAVELGKETAGFAPGLHHYSMLGVAVGAFPPTAGDGSARLLIGTPHWDGLGDWVGGVWELEVGPDAAVRDNRQLLASRPVLAAAAPDWDAASDQAPVQIGLGAAITVLGDLDGDGSTELVFGQHPGSDRRSLLDADVSPPCVVVASMGQDGSAARATGLRPFSEADEACRSGFGTALAAIGDVDGDGIVDLAIGQPGSDDGGAMRGAVVIAFLRPDGSIRAHRVVSDWSGGFEALLRDWTRFGQALAAPGDVDQDGVPDLLVGSNVGLWLLFLTHQGTVREHREIRDSRHGFTDVGTLGLSVACGREWSAEGSLPLVVGGLAGQGDATNEALWMLRLHRDGTVGPWLHR